MLVNKFNNPPSGESSPTISNFYLDCIKACENGSKVRGSFMHWLNADAYTDKLARILEGKSLDFKIVVGSDVNGAHNRISPKVREFVESRGGVARNRKVNGDKNHSKFWIFEKIIAANIGDTSGYVGPALMVSTANVNENAKHNTATLVAVTGAQYVHLKKYFDQLLKCAKDDGLRIKFPRTSINALNGVHHTTFHQFPVHTDSAGDVAGGDHPYSKIFEKIAGGGNIRIVTPRFRNTGVAKALIRALEKHSDLRATVLSRSTVFSEDHKLEVSEEVRNILATNERCTLKLHNNARNIHSKYMLFSGPYNHTASDFEAQVNILWTGTMNLTGATHHWEQILKTTQAAAFSEYQQNFEYLNSIT